MASAFQLIGAYTSDDEDDDDNKGEEKGSIGQVTHTSVTATAASSSSSSSSVPQVAASTRATETNDDDNNGDGDELDGLPPLPSQAADAAVVEKIKHYMSLKEEQGFDLTDSIRSKKNFGNPYIFNIAVEHFKIDEIGSNYPPELFDPHGYAESDFEPAIRKRYTGVPMETGDAALAPPIPGNAPAPQQPLLPQPQLQPQPQQLQLQQQQHQQQQQQQQPGRKRSRWDQSNAL
jgi:hypothetical protein